MSDEFDWPSAKRHCEKDLRSDCFETVEAEIDGMSHHNLSSLSYFENAFENATIEDDTMSNLLPEFMTDNSFTALPHGGQSSLTLARTEVSGGIDSADSAVDTSSYEAICFGMVSN